MVVTPICRDSRLILRDSRLRHSNMLFKRLCVGWCAFAAGCALQDFSQTTDEEVVAILKQHAQHSSHQPPAADATAAAAAAVAEPAGAETSAQQPPGGGTTPTPGTAAEVGSKAAAATAAAGTSHLAVDTAAVRDQAAGSSHNPPAMTPAAPTTPKTAAARTSSLAAALNHSPRASPTAAPVQRLRPVEREEVVITYSELGVQLHGILTVPEGALGLVVFAHGSGSSRNSPRNSMVAATLQKAGEWLGICLGSGAGALQSAISSLPHTQHQWRGQQSV